MTTYARPAVPPLVFRDAAGAVIPYGERWTELGRPPEDSYSVVSHPERFAPLHEVAAALIDHLRRDYDVDVVDDLRCAADLRWPGPDPVRAVRVTPRAADATRLTFVFTGFPGVTVASGLLHESRYPVCGCDACDESWTHLAGELEQHVEAVVSGRFREAVTVEDGTPWVWHEVLNADGSRDSRGGSSWNDDPRLAAAAARLDALSGGWAPWPLRRGTLS